jgi:hypothetical protein
MPAMRISPGPPAALLALLVLFPAAAPAEERGAAVCPAIDIPAPTAPGVRAFVDAATGKLREPTPDELRQLAEERLKARTARPQPVFEVVTHPDGMKTVDLGDAFLFDVRVETLPDGTLRTTCVPHATPSAAGAPK